MRAFLTCAVLTVTILTANTASAQPRHDAYEGLVDGWYHRYLGRHVDRIGLADHTRAIRHGTPPDVVEAAILSSEEYYHRNGCSPEGYVAALYRDVLGRRAGGPEFHHMVNRVLRHGRHAVAMQVLSERSIAFAPAPVVVARPYVVEPPVIVPSYRPMHRPAPVYVAPAPAISIRLNFGR